MAVNFYEVLFLVDPNKASLDVQAAMGALNGIIEQHGGEIVESRHWSDPKLMYPIKNFRKGMYILTYFRSPPGSIAPIEHDCKLNDLVLREMILKLHPRIAEDIIAHLEGRVPAEETA